MFDHIDTNIQNERNLCSYITARFDAPNSKSNAISYDQISNTVRESIYFGNYDKSIDLYKHPVSVYADSRIYNTNSLQLNQKGISSNGNESVYNLITLISYGCVDGSIYMRLDNDDANTPTSAFDNNIISNSSSSQIASLSANTANSIATNSVQSSSIPILQEIIDSDLSEYVLSWNVDVNSEENNKFVVSKTAKISLANVDSDPRGSSILDLFRKKFISNQN